MKPQEENKKNEELANAEVKRSKLIEKRDDFNDKSNQLKHERDLLNEKIRNLIEEIKPLKEERKAFLEELAVHKEKRNALQAEAKELIEFRREIIKKKGESPAHEIDQLKKDIDAIKFRQETDPNLSVSEENRIIDEMKRKMKRIESLRAVMTEKESINISIDEASEKIDKLFADADAEHEIVSGLHEKIGSHSERITDIGKQIDTLRENANKKHDEFLEMKEKGNQYHEKVLEMTSKILEIRNARRAEFESSEKMLREREELVRKKLYDEDEVDKKVEDSIERLKTAKKIEL